MSDTAVRCARPGRLLRVLGSAAVVCLAACAGKQGPPPESAHKVAPPRPVRLAWLPVEKLVVPEVAQALNERMSQVKIPGTTAGFRAAVSMEVAQLAIECIEATTACYAAVGRSLGADRVLWAELSPGQSPEVTVRIALMLFDVSADAAPRRVERTFEDTQAARAGIAEMVDHAFEAGGRSP